jgi:hypothetical protein
LRRLAPVATHLFRPQLEIYDRLVLGVVWSRKLGHAVSLALSHESVSPDELSAGLAEWLGYNRWQVLVDEIQEHTRVQIAREPNLTDDLFDLPRVAGASAS